MEILSAKLVLSLQAVANFMRGSIINRLKTVLVVSSIMVLPWKTAFAEGLEEGVKAAYLYKFSSYVEWPSTAFVSSTSPFTICVIGSSSYFNSTLKKVVHGESVSGRQIAVSEIDSLDDGKCHILYVGATDPQHSSALIDTVRGRNVLTVSDHASQGIIGFTITNNRLRFNIDDAAAAENGLVISSRLLKLAVNVKRRGSGE